MSCLYSSPGVKPPNSVGLFETGERPSTCSLCARCSDAVAIPADFVNRRLQQRRVPHPPTSPPADLSFSLSKQALLFLRRSSSAISGFRSICGRKRRSSHQPSRSIRPAFRNLSPGAASRENPGIAPASSRALHRCCGRNVVGPSEYSKRFLRSEWALSPHFSRPDRPGNARQVGFGARVSG